MGHFVTLATCLQISHPSHPGLRLRLGKESMDKALTTLFTLFILSILLAGEHIIHYHYCRRVLLSPGEAPVRPAALLLPGDGLRALLHDGVRLLDVLLAGPQGGEHNFNVEMFGGGAGGELN